MIDLKTEYRISSINDERITRVSRKVLKININGQDVFIKELDDNGIYAELIAAEIEDILNIPRVDMAIGVLDGKKYLLSFAAYEKEKEFIKGTSFLALYYAHNEGFIEANQDYQNYIRNEELITKRDLNSLHTIWNALESYIKMNKIEDVSIIEILNLLIDQFLFCGINDLIDFHSGNWALIHKGNSLKLYPRYDNDILDEYFEHRTDKNFYSMQIYDTQHFSSMDEILYNFLIISGNEYLERAMAMLNKILAIGIEKIISRVEEKWSIKIDNKDIFVSNYNKRLGAVRLLLGNIKKKLNNGEENKGTVNKQV